MAASAINFEADRTEIHQVLAGRAERAAPSGMPRRPDWDTTPLTVPASRSTTAAPAADDFASGDIDANR